MKNILASLLMIAFVVMSYDGNAEGLGKYQVNQGTIGCAKRENLLKVIEFALLEDALAMQEMVLNGKCIFLAKGHLLYASPDICRADDKPTDFFSFRPKGSSQLVYLACSFVKKLN